MLYLCIGKRSGESSVQVKTYRSVLVDGFSRVHRNVINDIQCLQSPSYTRSTPKHHVLCACGPVGKSVRP